MNARERAIEVFNRMHEYAMKEVSQKVWDDWTKEQIEQAITAAEEAKAKEEREACRKAVRSVADELHPERDHVRWSQWTNAIGEAEKRIRDRSEGKNQQKGVEEMTTQERLTRVYNLITAAHSLLNKGQLMNAIGLIQTARIIVSHSDEFLALNKVQVDKDCETALALIQKESEGEKKGE